MRRKFVLLGDAPRIGDALEFELKISKAVLASLEKRGLITPVQAERCADALDARFICEQKRRGCES